MNHDHGVQQIDSVCFEITDRCPLACSHCSVSAGPARNRVLPFDIFRRIVGFARDKGCSEIILAGGEPLSLFQFPSYAMCAHKTGAVVSVFTSGIIFGEEESISVRPDTYRNYREKGVTRVVFSVYADDAIVHDKITRTPGSLRQTLDSMDNARAAELQCEINFVPMKPNWGHLAGILKLAADLGVSRVNCLRFVPQGRGLGNERFLQVEVEDEESFARSVAELIQGEFGLMLRLGRSFKELMPWAVDDQTMSKRSLHVTISGEVLQSADRRSELVGVG